MTCNCPTCRADRFAARFGKWLMILLLLILAIFSFAKPVEASTGPLEASIAQVTGITRNTSDRLDAVAQWRLNDIQSDFSHNGQLTPGEVLIWHEQITTDPITWAVNGWLNSPPHRAALFNSELRDIGCAYTTFPTNYGTGAYAVCVLDWGTQTAYVPAPVTSAPAPAAPAPKVMALPDTASDGINWFQTILLSIGIWMIAMGLLILVHHFTRHD